MSFGIGCSGGGGGLWVLANCYLLVLCFFIFGFLPMVVAGIGCGFAGWLTLDNGRWWLDMTKRTGQVRSIGFAGHWSIGLRVGSDRVRLTRIFQTNFFFSITKRLISN